MFLLSCAGPTPGPDKQFAGGLQGAVTGAGSGAITGFQVGSGTGPGAVLGAGIGAVAGGLQGMTQDSREENLLNLSAASRSERELARVQEVLQDHFRRRMELHPTRDIFPADLFFFGDQSVLRADAKALVDEIARMNKERFPWSRMGVISYQRAAGEGNEFARRLAQKRARQIADRMVRAGLGARRISAQAVLIEAPLVLDPLDRADRYNQAIEFAVLDRVPPVEATPVAKSGEEKPQLRLEGSPQ